MNVIYKKGQHKYQQVLHQNCCKTAGKLFYISRKIKINELLYYLSSAWPVLAEPPALNIKKTILLSAKFIKMKDYTSYENIVAEIPGTKLENKFQHFWELVGNTPMLEISYRYKRDHRKIYVKC